mmetsp:Transcript_221/g.699  ORF Transcript_221/g.699 Transcript_221/m.699 type:complete len:390 (-) Transcript_221:785-1954(-)|eukprot:CAMPEP_0198732150 /NCGR_PEP_ID=MMETSP1475-20131203/34096_1 /TAXON_ID= ORGANISM="Unidentified sp., Strain CCMP1999" /NCGR_SAMPLE_ID=MMETSP1475 /ASSEMBLY_ACC=CAM_ASM_001111 /LENGTH=389 /DNA_ID=CAMNT_0044495207 /DNA_START=89 /DNA_END=1258 /DNA_ORIENTATION=+
MLLERVEEGANELIYVYIRVEGEDESVEELQTLLNTEAAKFWSRPLSTNDQLWATMLADAQRSGREYEVVLLGRHDELLPQSQLSDVDKTYYTSYGDIEVHRLMLKDTARTEAYLKAIEISARPSITVIDVGSGSGILSLALAKHGAVVHAVEASQKMSAALGAIFAKNRAEIRLHQCRVEALHLAEKVDLIVSEWMGFYLLHESMLSSVLQARNRFLKPGGRVMPCSARIYMALVSLDDVYDQQIGMWDNVYSFDLSPLRELARERLVSTPLIMDVDPRSLISDPVTFAELDLAKVEPEDIKELRKLLKFRVNRASNFHGVCCFWDVELCKGVELSTAPTAPATHWKQSVFMLGSAHEVEDNDVITCMVEMSQSSNNHRHYDITLSLS